jgi:hypothetical protein
MLYGIMLVALDSLLTWWEIEAGIATEANPLLNLLASHIGINAVLVLRVVLVSATLYVVRHSPYIRTITSLLLFPIIWHLVVVIGY